jgi:hypothetical protein
MIVKNKQKCNDDCGFLKFVILSGIAIVIARPQASKTLAMPLRHRLSRKNQ